MELRELGVDVVALSAGEPDFETPEHIKQAAIAAIHEGKTRYTAVDGTAELKAAIIRKFERDQGLSYHSDQISVATGAKQALYNALIASLNEGDEVIIPAPYWVSYPAIVRLTGAQPVIVSCDSSDDYKLNPQKLRAAITPKTRWLLLNSPSNPTGAIYSAQELKALAAVLDEHPQVWVLCDDIYELLRYDDCAFATLPQIAPQLAERSLIINGFSKGYAMTGWRLGYAAGPSMLIAQMRKLQSQSTSCPSSISQAAAIAALDGSHDFLSSFISAFQARRDAVLARLAKIDGLKAYKPQGAFYIFIDAQELLNRSGFQDDVDFCRFVLEEHHLALVPGSAFGAEGHLRLSFAASQEQLDKALDRLEAACKSV